MAKSSTASDPQGSFRTYLRYLEAFSTIWATRYSAGVESTTLLHILAGIRNHLVQTGLYQKAATRASVGSSVNLPLLSSALKNAWGTELLLCITPGLSDDEEYRKLANNWASVQAYYSCYHIAQALTLSQGNPPPDTHAKLQRVFTRFWQAPMNLVPLSMGWKNGQCYGLPQDIETHEVKPWLPWSTVTADSCWSYAALVLKTTREEVLTERREEERQQGRRKRQRERNEKEQARVDDGKTPLKHLTMSTPNLSQEEKNAIDERMRSTTLLDVLYRLRKRSNYEDPTMFIDGPESPEETVRVHQCLREIVAATCMAHEVFIREYAGAAWFDGEVSGWIQGSGSISQAGLATRQALLAGQRQFPG